MSLYVIYYKHRTNEMHLQAEGNHTDTSLTVHVPPPQPFCDSEEFLNIFWHAQYEPTVMCE